MLLVSYGTRPEWIKIKPVLNVLDLRNIKYRLLFTGQHTTLINEKYDVKLDIFENKNRFDSIFLSVLGHDEIFVDIDRVMVQGDTASSFAVALAAFHRKISVIHLEAGLRTNNVENPYPEESYRRFISSIATVHFCPTVNNVKNLENEKVNGKIYLTGNTSIDAIKKFKKEVSTENTCIITLHRYENRNIINDWIISINKLAEGP